jgi:hypothetical protein
MFSFSTDENNVSKGSTSFSFNKVNQPTTSSSSTFTKKVSLQNSGSRKNIEEYSKEYYWSNSSGRG